LLVTTSTGGTTTVGLTTSVPCPIEDGTNDGEPLPPLSEGETPLPLLVLLGRGTTTVVVLETVVDVRSVVVASPESMGQTVVPMGTTTVVSRPGQPVVTDGGHEVMVWVEVV
jgi:hypothetical protein